MSYDLHEHIYICVPSLRIQLSGRASCKVVQFLVQLYKKVKKMIFYSGIFKKKFRKQKAFVFIHALYSFLVFTPPLARARAMEGVNEIDNAENDKSLCLYGSCSLMPGIYLMYALHMIYSILYITDATTCHYSTAL